MTDYLRTRIAAAIYAGVMESCDGYVEGQESGFTVDPTDPDDALVVDGRITYTVVADAVIRELEAGYVLVPKNVTLVQWADEAFQGQTEGKFKHERITEWTADE